jgi:hypothetical protein
VASISFALALGRYQGGTYLDQHGALTVQQKELLAIVPMHLHPHVADRDTIVERFDEDPVFKEWDEPSSFKDISGTLFFEILI